MIFELFSYPFMRMALLTGGMVALCASLLGVPLVLKRYSMIGDGLSHVGFGTLSVAMAINFFFHSAGFDFAINPLLISVPIVIIAAFLLLKISERSKIKGDAAIALISSCALAAGIIVTSLSSGMNLDVYGFMFGSIVTISEPDMWICVCLSAVILVLYVLFYNHIFAAAFDDGFMKAAGSKIPAKTLIAMLTAITIVVGMRIMGTLLISSLIIFPGVTSMRVFKSFKRVVVCSGIVSVVCFAAGLAVSGLLSLPVGAAVVAVNAVVFFGFSAAGAAMKL